MRDKERINRITKQLNELWHTVPDWRLGQLLVNATNITDDMFFVEDDVIEKRLSELRERLNDN